MDPAAGRVCRCVPARRGDLWVRFAWPTFSLFSGHPFPPRLLAGAQAGVPVPWGVPGDGCGARGPAGSHFCQVSSGASTGVHGYLGALGRLNAVGPSVA